MPGDNIAVTGFGGNAWYLGAVGGEVTVRGKSRFRVTFTADNSFSDLELKGENYGPATFTDAGKANMGWVYVLNGVDPRPGGTAATDAVDGRRQVS